MRFDVRVPRECSAEWTRDTRAITEFADGFPILVISRASLDELNSRLPKALPMERFRPNVVIDGVARMTRTASTSCVPTRSRCDW